MQDGIACCNERALGWPHAAGTGRVVLFVFILAVVKE
jgi:hypothetical protein